MHKLRTYFDEGTLVVRCNQCEYIYPEDNIKVKEDGETEYCENCGSTGKFMDLGIFGETDDRKLFPELSGCKDWEEVKKNFHLNILCDFENEIHDYNYCVGTYAENVDDYPFIIQWYEGLFDTKELIEHYSYH